MARGTIPSGSLAMRAFGLHPATLAATCMLVLAGCGGVSFEHPLSDEKTTEVDESLIGFWEPVASSLGEEDPAPGELWPRIAVGKDAAGGKRMEAVALQVEDGVVKVERLEALATRIGESRYLSLRKPQESDKNWFVVQYEVTGDDELRCRILDAEAFAQAVDDGELEGEARGPERGHEVVDLTVRISASTEAVRAWIAKHADSCLEEKGLTLRRLVKKESSGSAEAPEPPDEPGDD